MRQVSVLVQERHNRVQRALQLSRGAIKSRKKAESLLLEDTEGVQAENAGTSVLSEVLQVSRRVFDYFGLHQSGESWRVEKDMAVERLLCQMINIKFGVSQYSIIPRSWSPALASSSPTMAGLEFCQSKSSSLCCIPRLSAHSPRLRRRFWSTWRIFYQCRSRWIGLPRFLLF